MIPAQASPAASSRSTTTTLAPDWRNSARGVANDVAGAGDDRHLPRNSIIACAPDHAVFRQPGTPRRRTNSRDAGSRHARHTRKRPRYLDRKYSASARQSTYCALRKMCARRRRSETHAVEIEGVGRVTDQAGRGRKNSTRVQAARNVDDAAERRSPAAEPVGSDSGASTSQRPGRTTMGPASSSPPGMRGAEQDADRHADAGRGGGGGTNVQPHGGSAGRNLTVSFRDHPRTVSPRRRETSDGSP